jgi:plastocyanin
MNKKACHLSGFPADRKSDKSETFCDWSVLPEPAGCHMKKLRYLLSTCLTPLVLLAFAAGASVADGSTADTYNLTDEPGNWFKSENTGTPFTVIKPGERVDFEINNCCTSTKHTVTLLMKPTGSNVVMDQDQAQRGSLSVDFDRPGVYLFHCKRCEAHTDDSRWLDSADGSFVRHGPAFARSGRLDQQAHS